MQIVSAGLPIEINDITGDLSGDCKVDFAAPVLRSISSLRSRSYFGGVGTTKDELMVNIWLECNLDPKEACW
jgi:hypothetical protein